MSKLKLNRFGEEKSSAISGHNKDIKCKNSGWIKKIFHSVLAFYIKDEQRGFPSINSYFWRIRKKDGPWGKENTKPRNNSEDILIDIFAG